MLEDEVRVRSFRKALFATCRGKVVLDVGCGSGVLSLFAAQAGAIRVVAVEGSARAAKLAREAMRRNGFENKVTVVCGRIEDEAVAEEVGAALSQQHPGGPSANGGPPTADVIVSEWMGYMLVYEDMFRSVAVARDRWLHPDGCMIPAKCSVWAAPFCGRDLADELAGFWRRKPYGLDMQHLIGPAMEEVCARPVIDELEPQCLLARPAQLWRLDCRADPADVASSQCLAFSFELDRAMPLHGLAAWFTCLLAPGIGFSTGPGMDTTHWAQTLLFADSSGSDKAGGTPEASIVDGIRCGRGDCFKGELRWEAAPDRSLRVSLRGLLSPHGGEAGPVPEGAPGQSSNDNSVPVNADFDWQMEPSA